MKSLRELQQLAGIEITESTRFDHAAYKERVKGMSDDALEYTRRDAKAAIEANPDSEKSRSGYYQDEINYCSDELYKRKQSGRLYKNQQTDEAVASDTVPLLFEPNTFIAQMEKSFKDHVDAISYSYSDEEADRLDRFKLPKDVKKACDDRISELKASIDVEDAKGYNDTSIKQQAIECIEQILKNLSANNQEGFKQSVIFVDTLMSILVDLMPSQLLKYLRVSKA